MVESEWVFDEANRNSLETFDLTRLLLWARYKGAERLDPNFKRRTGTDVSIGRLLGAFRDRFGKATNVAVICPVGTAPLLRGPRVILSEKNARYGSAFDLQIESRIERQVRTQLRQFIAQYDQVIKWRDSII
ncbi:MAG: hypothetical protein ACYCQJ_04000 [Nitrososphaerales archaeon]